MVLATAQKAIVQPDTLKDLSYPCGYQSDWVVVCTAPDAVESDTGVVVSGKVVKPGAIVRATQARFKVEARATSLLVALKYNSDVGTPTAPVVRIFGRDRNGVWHVLKTAAGAHEITLTVAVTTDALSDDGAYKVTTPVEVDCEGSLEVIVGVQTAFAAGSGTATDSEILVKPKNNR